MNNEYFTISNSEWTKLKVKNSKFFSKAFYTETKTKVDKIHETISQKHANANHIVYAYRLKNRGKTIEYSTDAGEPVRSSGPPILKVIKGRELLNTVVFVVRYFGGIKLGIGGLIKAYTNSAHLALEASRIIKKINLETVKLKTDYDNLGTILKKIEQHKGNITDVKYGQKITVSFKILKSDLINLRQDPQLNLSS